MAIASIADQPITTRRLVDYVRPTGHGADQASLRSLLAAAGFPAADGAAALTEQVRRFQQSQIAGGQRLVHGADGKAGPETLAALRRVVGSTLDQAEIPSGLADRQADAFVAAGRRAGGAPSQTDLERAPPPGAARPGTDEAATRRAVEEALRQRVAGATEPLTPGEANREAIAELGRRGPPTPGDQLRLASADRARLAVVRRELSAMERESAVRPDPSWSQRAERLMREQDGLTARLAANPQNARFDELERAQRDVAEVERMARGRRGMTPEIQRALDAARARVDGLASELGFRP